MREPVDRPVIVWQVAEILNVAYEKTASVHNAVSGFRKSGLCPVTIDVFQDSDNISGNDAPTPANNRSDIKGVSADPESNIMKREPDTTILLPDVNTENMQVQNADRPAGNGITVVKHVNELSPLPKSSIQRRNRTRPTSQAAELTSNPYKKYT